MGIMMNAMDIAIGKHREKPTKAIPVRKIEVTSNDLKLFKKFFTNEVSGNNRFKWVSVKLNGKTFVLEATIPDLEWGLFTMLQKSDKKKYAVGSMKNAESMTKGLEKAYKDAVWRLSYYCKYRVGAPKIDKSGLAKGKPPIIRGEVTITGMLDRAFLKEQMAIFS